MEEFLDIIKDLPWFADAALIMGTFRIVCKPLFGILETIVKATPSQADDRILGEMRNTSTYRLLAWAIDYFASVKLPKGGR